jgi:hypothetical protein
VDALGIPLVIRSRRRSRPPTSTNLIEWHRAIRQGAPHYPGLDDGIRAVLPVFAAETAARARREVPVGEVFRP